MVVTGKKGCITSPETILIEFFSEFDGLGFVSGIQLMADNFATVVQGGNGIINNVNVLKSVVDQPDIFA
jgi:sulfopyruvate decarboxylase TPP-binding subunit